MAEPAKTNVTYEDLLKVPDPFVAEIADGDLFVSPRPSPRHANASSAIGADLTSPYHRGRGGGGWMVDPR